MVTPRALAYTRAVQMAVHVMFAPFGTYGAERKANQQREEKTTPSSLMAIFCMPEKLARCLLSPVCGKSFFFWSIVSAATAK